MKRSMNQNTSSTKTIPGIPKEGDRKICTWLMVHIRRSSQLSAKTRCPCRKNNNWHIFTHLFVSAAQHTKGQRRPKIWEKHDFFFPQVLRYCSQQKKESLFSLKTSIQIGLRNKDNFFICLFQLKYYPVSAEV